MKLKKMCGVCTDKLLEETILADYAANAYWKIDINKNLELLEQDYC